MQNLFFRKTYSILSASLLAAMLALLTACGNGGTSGASGTTTTGGGGTTTPTAAASLILVLTDPVSGATVTGISNGTSAKVNAALKDATGAAVTNTVITFSTASTMATMTPSSGTALTDAAGVATITLTGGATAGATTITATAQVGTSAVNGSIGYSVGSLSVTITNPVFGVNPLSAFGTTSVSVIVSSGGVPVTSAQTVTFSSPCASSGNAVLSTSAVTVSGVAIGSYRDNGCAGTDIVTASVSGITSSSATLTVIAPTTGSIQYVSSVPTNISLKGTGSTEVSQVTFKVLDTGGNPLSGKVVTFGLSTTVGGIILTPNTGTPFTTGTATSDANGLVVTNVNSGTVSTPVRVTATTTGAGGVSLTTQSSQLTITTGIPDQFGISLVATTHNMEGWNYDGTTSVLTVRLADHFKNPVPDGTAVVFTAEAGTVVGSCVTVSGSCSATYTSSGTRPTNGRATVLAYAVGEETFTDVNGSGWADLASGMTPANEMIDPNGNATDLPEAFVDYNENGVLNAGEPFIDFNQSGAYNVADGKFNGVLCDDVTTGRSSAGTCSQIKTIHVRSSQIMVLSSSYANITINGGVTPIVVTPCNVTTGNTPFTFVVTVVDVNGNAMPAGTTVAFTKDNGTITSDASYIVPDTIGCRTGGGCPAFAASATFGDIPVTMKSDAAFVPATSCTNTTPSGTFTVKVTSPKGLITTATATITD